MFTEKRSLVWVMALLIALTVPGASLAYAEGDEGTHDQELTTLVEEGPEETESIDGDVNSDDEQVVTEGEAEEAVLEESAEEEIEEPLEEAIDEPVEEVVDKSDVELAAQADVTLDAQLNPQVNTTLVRVTIPNLADILAQSAADSVTVKATMSYGGTVTRSVSKTQRLADIASGSFDVDFKDFGPFTATVTFSKSGSVVKTLSAKTVNVTAETYNIAPLYATMPVTMFSLSLWGDDCVRTAGPTMVMLHRAGAYDWNCLPAASGDRYGVYGVPYLTYDQLKTQQDLSGAHGYFINTLCPATEAYIKDLYRISPSAQFNFYFGDTFCCLAHSMIYANKIPEDQYTINLLSDGTASYTQSFGSVYTSSDPSAQHATLVSEWTAAKQKEYETGRVSDEFVLPKQSITAKYVWSLIDSEPNARWWLVRKQLLETSGDGNAFGTTVQASSKIKAFNIANSLNSIKSEGDDSIAGFKSLFNFNDGYFSAAEEQGKDAMVFLGSRANEVNEPNFTEYARFIMEYYGDAYVYYYKGHPATPTDFYPNKQAQLDALGVIDVDSTIAAELILFFNPEIYLSGYASSTYASVPKGMGKGMFNMSKETGLGNPNYVNMDFWMTKVGDATPAAAKALCDTDHENFLVEFSDEVISAEGYDIAIWDATDSIIKYYKLEEDGSYTLVKTGGSGIKGDMSLPAGIYYIQSSLKDNLMMTNQAAQNKLWGNINVWSHKGSFNQRWRLTYDKVGMATLTNLKSGYVLTVANDNAKNSANVSQAKAGNQDTRKWNVKRNNDGTYSIITGANAKLAVTVSQSKTANGTNVVLSTNKAADNQKWYFIALNPGITTEGQATIADGYYTLTSKVSTDRQLAVSKWSSVNGGNVVIEAKANTLNQKFKITKQKSGFYRIENVFSGKVLDVEKSALISGTNVVQWSANGGKNQEWKAVSLLDGTYTFQNVATGLYLDVTGGKKTSGTNVEGYRAKGNAAQRWFLAKVGDPWSAAKTLVGKNRGKVAAGTYVIRAKARKKAVLDVARGSKKNGANVQLSNWAKKSNQKWKISYDSEGYAYVVNAKSGMSLTVGKTAFGANVYQAKLEKTNNQKWIVVKQSDGSVSFVPALGTKLVLDSSHGKNAAGTNVLFRKYTAGKSQRFVLTKK